MRQWQQVEREQRLREPAMGEEEDLPTCLKVLERGSWIDLNLRRNRGENLWCQARQHIYRDR